MTHADAFIDYLNTYFTHKEIYDDELRKQLLQQEIDIIDNPKIVRPPANTIYFSPSASNSCNRELYLKAKGARRDDSLRTPIQSRWTELGTLVGDTVQKSILKAEKHWDKIAGGQAPYTAHRTEEGYPFWEDFAKRLTTVHHKGKDIHLFGKPDGVLKCTETGEFIGLEVKSKSTTPARTSHFSLREPSEDHTLQTACYELMYPEIEFSSYLILYWNVAKKGWNADYHSDPDLRCFEIKNTEEKKIALLDKFHDILTAVETNTPPPLDLSKFTFNNYKTACSLDLSEEEVEELKQQVRNVKASGVPQYVKNSYHEAMKFIVDTRCKYGK